MFTASGFDNFFIGVVLGRDKQYLVNGQLIVELIDNVQPQSFSSFLSKYTLNLINVPCKYLRI